MLTEINQTPAKLRLLLSVGRFGWFGEAARHESRNDSNCPAYHAISEPIEVAPPPHLMYRHLPPCRGSTPHRFESW